MINTKIRLSTTPKIFKTLFNTPLFNRKKLEKNGLYKNARIVKICGKKI